MSFSLLSDLFLDNRNMDITMPVGIEIILLGDSMKLYKLATFSCKLRQQNSRALRRLTESYSTKNGDSTMHFGFIPALFFGLFTIRQGYPVHIYVGDPSWHYQSTFQCHELHLFLPRWAGPKIPFVRPYAGLLQPTSFNWCCLSFWFNWGLLSLTTSTWNCLWHGYNE